MAITKSVSKKQTDYLVNKEYAEVSLKEYQNYKLKYLIPLLGNVGASQPKTISAMDKLNHELRIMLMLIFSEHVYLQSPFMGTYTFGRFVRSLYYELFVVLVPVESKDGVLQRDPDRKEVMFPIEHFNPDHPYAFVRSEKTYDTEVAQVKRHIERLKRMRNL